MTLNLEKKKKCEKFCIDNGFEEMDTIIEINNNDLIEIGINKKGHRIKILKMIEKYKKDSVSFFANS